jgi:Fic family protein
MQVVSGPIGRERVHYQAPAADRLDHEMRAFLDWFNAPDTTDPVIKAGLAHLWLVTIHPFDDGNGRIARAIADMSLARSEQSPQRFDSMSSEIRRERNAYYDTLETTQKGDLEVTPWLQWFLSCLDRAFDDAETIPASVPRMAGFRDTWATAPFNPRQRAIINGLLDGFEGKLKSSKWTKLGKCSEDTALRDIDGLSRLGILVKEAAGGRRTSYALVGGVSQEIEECPSKPNRGTQPRC